MNREIRFIVTVDRPEGVLASELREYIRESVQAMKGSLMPDDPPFDLDRDSVRVVYAKDQPANPVRKMRYKR